ncbi:MAG: hypothetical protein DDT34_02184 [Firmicutes bacterium]|nr:hypothetical protein [Bacillota bacterium]
MLSFKKLKFHDEYTQETDAYTADVYWAKTFIGSAENTGKGGMTNLSNWTEKKRSPAYRKAIEEATAFAKTQMYSNPDLGNYDTLEDYIDSAAWQARRIKDVQKALAKRLTILRA